MRIVIVEDEAPIREGMEGILKNSILPMSWREKPPMALRAWRSSVV